MTVTASFVTAFCLLGTGYVVAAFAPTLVLVLPAMMLVGAGTGLLLPNFTAKAVSDATPSMRGRVAGLMSASVFMGQFLSPLCTHPMVVAFGGRATFLVLAAFYFLIGLALIVVRARRIGLS